MALKIKDRRKPNSAVPESSPLVQAKLNEAVALHQQGKLEQAIALYSDILKVEPRHFDAIHLLGVIADQMKNHQLAVDLIDQAIAINSSNADAHFNRGNALKELNQLDVAVASYDKAITLNPRYAHAYNNRGVVLQKLNQLSAAVESYNKAVRIKPDYAEAHFNLGVALQELKRFDEALASYRRVATLRPDHAMAYYNSGVALNALNRFDEALNSFDHAVSLKPDFAIAHYYNGVLLNRMGRFDEALASYDRAIALGFHHAEAYSNRGATLTQQGDIAAAAESYHHALRIKPDYVECYRNYSNITKFKNDDPLIAKMKKLIDAGGLSETDLMHLHFALGKAEHDLGNGERSIKQLIQGNSARKKGLGYDISRDVELFAAIKTFFESDGAGHQVEYEDSSSVTPVFILGMPRSGTTLVEQIASSHSRVFGAGELAFLNLALIKSQWRLDKQRQQVFDTVRSFYLQKLSESSRAPIIIDKMPLNFRWIGFIRNALPEAKIIHLIRDPAAVCWSNYKTYFPSEEMAFTFDLEDIAKYYKLYEDLMAFWNAKYPGAIYNLDYEKLTENQEEETRKLLAHLDLGWEDSVLKFHENKRTVSTASKIQVRQGMYQGSSLEWKKYEQWLQPMLGILNA